MLASVEVEEAAADCMSIISLSFSFEGGGHFGAKRLLMRSALESLAELLVVVAALVSWAPKRLRCLGVGLLGLFGSSGFKLKSERLNFEWAPV